MFRTGAPSNFDVSHRLKDCLNFGWNAACLSLAFKEACDSPLKPSLCALRQCLHWLRPAWNGSNFG